MSLNIHAIQTGGVAAPTATADASPDDCAPPAPSADQVAAGAEPRRRQLVEELLAELTSWNPRELILTFQRMHRAALSIIHLNVLTILEAEEPMSMGHLAETMDVSVASMTGIVTRMEARGLVERIHDARDRRVVLVRRTQGGFDVFRGIEEHRRAGLTRLMAELSDEELSGLLLGHRALRTARTRMMQARAAAAVQSGESGGLALSGEEARS